MRKAPTGIAGFDDITLGGLPAGRPTLICGSAGSGKTLLALSFLANGAIQCGEPGVFLCFEERPEDLTDNFASLGYDLGALVAGGSLMIDHVQVDRSSFTESGEYDLEGLFVRLGFAVDAIGAKRVAIDTLECLFAGFSDTAMLRAELQRLFGWLKDRGLTAVITGERGDGALTRHGLEEYISDCVILLDNRVEEQIATRRLRIVKYRGSPHATNEFPFLIDAEGITVLPVTSSGIVRPVSNDIISSGITGLDGMMRNGGFFRGSSILLSGVAGTGKTTVASQLINAACGRGERCMFFVFEEGGQEVIRNVTSVGIDLQTHVAKGLLRLEEARPSLHGLETHLARMHRDLDQFRPSVVVLDPISAFLGPAAAVHSVLLRMVDLLKRLCVSALFTSLRSDEQSGESGDHGLASLMDTWIDLRDVQASGERNRILYIRKSRGSSHSNQLREYRMTDAGIEIIPPYTGPDGVLTGSARLTQEAREQAEAERRQQSIARRKREIGRRRQALERQIAELRVALEVEEEEAMAVLRDEEAREARWAHDRDIIAARRSAAG